MSRGRNYRPEFANRVQDDSISMSQLARFLKRLSALYRDPITGNPALSEALLELSSALRRRPDIPLDEVVENLNVSSKLGHHFGDTSHLKNLEPEKVEQLLFDDTLTKTDLIRLGNVRFAISRSRLERLKKAEICEAIGAALRNEESLNIISEEARRGGTTRSS